VSTNSNTRWQVYIVRCSDDSLYTGVAKDVAARVAEHNTGNGARYTRARLPVELVYTEEAPDRGAAQRREAAIKKLSAVEKRTLLCAGTPRREP
jgi:predicted GIY-YIG superfamily endonuclease